MTIPTQTSLSVAYDPEVAQWRFEGGPPGPAGLALVELADGVQLTVDAVDPTRIVELTINLEGCDPTSAPSPMSLGIVRALLGEPMAAYLVAQTEGTVAIEVESVPVDPGAALDRALAGRLALLTEWRALELADGSESPWWDVEEVCVRAELAARPGLAGIAPAPSQTVAAAEFVRSFAAAFSSSTFSATPSATSLSPDQRRRLLSRVRLLGQIVGPIQADLAAKLGRLEGPHMLAEHDVASAFATLTAQLSDLGDRAATLIGRLQPDTLTLLSVPRDEPAEEVVDRFLVQLDADAVPHCVLAAKNLVLDWYRSHDEVRAHIALGPDTSGSEVAQLWVRAFARTRDAPPYLIDLSKATLDPDQPGYAVARLLISRQFSPGQILIDVTDRPNEPLLTPASRARHRAVGDALLATAHDRRRDPHAPDRWVACHKEWIAAGDIGRAALALALGARSLSDDNQGARLLERARELLAMSQATWVEEYLGQLREVPEPFDSELFDLPSP